MRDEDWADRLASGCVTDMGDVTDTPEHRAPIAALVCSEMQHADMIRSRDARLALADAVCEDVATYCDPCPCCGAARTQEVGTAAHYDLGGLAVAGHAIGCHLGEWEEATRDDAADTEGLDFAGEDMHPIEPEPVDAPVHGAESADATDAKGRG